MNKSNKYIDYIPFVFFFILYLFLLSQNLSITHDSIEYIQLISSQDIYFHPNHLIYQPALLLLVTTLSKVTGIVDIQLVTESVGAFFGALAIQAGYLIMTKRLCIEANYVWAGIAAIGFSFGIWYYSIAIEVYIFSLCFIAWAFYFLSSEQMSYRLVMAAAILQSLAIIFHQAAVLFSFVPLVALLTIKGISLSQKIKFLGLYIAIGTIIVTAAYIGVAIVEGQADSVDGFISWFFGVGGSDRYWNELTPKTILLAAVGFGRALIGAHFMFGIPQIKELFQSFFPGNTLEDEIFFAQETSQVIVYLLAALSIVVIFLIVFMVLRALINFINGNYRSPLRGVILLLFWMIPFTLFFIAWDPSNADLWVIQVFVFWILITTLLNNSKNKKTSNFISLATCGVFLLIINGLGSVLPANDPELDLNRVTVKQLKKHVGPQDQLIIGDGWPLLGHIDYHSEIHVIAMSDIYNEIEIDEFLDQVRVQFENNEKVFIYGDVINSARSSIEYYGEQYVNYLDEIRKNICGADEIVLIDEISLYRLTCIN